MSQRTARGRNTWEAVAAVAFALLLAATATLAGAAKAHAFVAVTNIYPDVRDPGWAAGDRQAASASQWGRSIVLHLSDADDMAWASIGNGQPTDEVWMDRSYDGGATWSSDSKIGDTTIPSGQTGWRTMMYNFDNPGGGQHGVLWRSCPSRAAATAPCCPGRRPSRRLRPRGWCRTAC